MNSATRNRAQELRRRLDIQNDIYREAVKRLSGEDTKWNERQISLREQLYAHITSFNAQDPESKAVYILGRVRGIVDELQAPKNIVAQYDSDKLLLEAMISDGKKE